MFIVVVGFKKNVGFCVLATASLTIGEISLAAFEAGTDLERDRPGGLNTLFTAAGPGKAEVAPRCHVASAACGGSAGA